jgi:tetratricopeptide (TPR) repeat protein
MRDATGLEVSTDEAAAIAAIDRFRTDLLALGPGVGDVLAAAAAHPGQTLLQCYAACLGLYGQCPAGDRDAVVHIEQARKAAGSANPRERAFLAAIEDWCRRRYEDATAKLEAIIAEWPRDLVAAKTLEFMYFARGQHYSGPRFLTAMQGIERANAESGYFLSIYSFALELSGRYDDSLRAAERAVALEPNNPWAHHTMAHAYLKTGAIAHGIAALDGQRAIWDASGQVTHSHNYWHLALMHLEQLDADAAYGFLHRPILEDTPHIMVQMVDAVSLLWRLEMAGFAVPRVEWESIAGEVAGDARQCYTAFNSAHFVYALARAGNDAALADAFRAIEGQIASLGGDEQVVWLEVGLPLLHGCVAHARGDYADAADRLDALMGPDGESVVRAGGSDAQVDLFRQAYLTSLIGSGQKSAASAYLDRIATSPVTTPLQAAWRARC